MADIHDPLEKALSRGSLAQQVALGPNHDMSDQEIRARALECAVRIYTGSKFATEKDVLSTTIDFEAYIRGEGK